MHYYTSIEQRKFTPGHEAACENSIKMKLKSD